MPTQAEEECLEIGRVDVAVVGTVDEAKRSTSRGTEGLGAPQQRLSIWPAAANLDCLTDSGGAGLLASCSVSAALSSSLSISYPLPS